MKCKPGFILLIILAATGTPAFSQDSPFLVGEFTVTEVIDGDTIAVKGLEKTIRFLCIDTEECMKGPGAKGRSDRLKIDFAAYARKHVRENPIGQFKTPLGWEAKKFAARWFAVGSTVRIEYDSLVRKTGYYNRVLGYVFARRDGKWVNYNVECVRAGMSPYFDKYGRSLRFEGAFIAAEREARIRRRGIWSRYAMAYPNYDERLRCWHRRAETITRFETKHGAEKNAVSIMDEDDWGRLAGLVDREVLLFGTVKALNEEATPPVLEMHHKQFARMAVTLSSRKVFDAVKVFLEAYEHDFILVRGVLGPIKEVGGREYPYTLEVSDRKQVFTDIPGDEEAIRFPAREVSFKGHRIHWKDAEKYVDREVTVVGKICRTSNIGKITFLNFDADFRTTLSLVIKEENYKNFEETAEVTYMGRTIAVHGKITLHKNALQMVITGPHQMEILE